MILGLLSRYHYLNVRWRDYDDVEVILFHFFFSFFFSFFFFFFFFLDPHFVLHVYFSINNDFSRKFKQTLNRLTLFAKQKSQINNQCLQQAQPVNFQYHLACPIKCQYP